MKTIRIKQGSYGLSKPNSSGVITKTRTDPPFEIEDAEAERLIELGVAEYATGAPSQGSADKGGSGGKGNIGSTLTLPQLERLNKPTLEALAKGRGVDISGATNNKGRAKLIWADLEEAHLAVVEVKEGVYEIVDPEEEDGTVDDDVIEDGDTPPVLGADEPVD